MTNEKLCCDLEHSKLLAETGLMEDVEADLIFVDGEFHQPWEIYFYDDSYGETQACDYAYLIKQSEDPEDYATYRLDRLLAKLQELSVGQQYISAPVPGYSLPQFIHLHLSLMSHSPFLCNVGSLETNIIVHHRMYFTFRFLDIHFL